MASQLDYVQYVADQAVGAGVITFRKMFGDYGIYCDGKIFGLICDDRFFVNPTQAGATLLGTPVLASPYDGAKDYFLISDVDDRDFYLGFGKSNLC